MNPEVPFDFASRGMARDRQGRLRRPSSGRLGMTAKSWACYGTKDRAATAVEWQTGGSGTAAKPARISGADAVVSSATAGPIQTSEITDEMKEKHWDQRPTP